MGASVVIVHRQQHYGKFINEILPHPPFPKEGFSLPSFLKRGRGRFFKVIPFYSPIFLKTESECEALRVSLVKPVVYLS